MSSAIRQYMKMLGRRYGVGKVRDRDPDGARDFAWVRDFDDSLGGGEDERTHCNDRSARRRMDFVEPADEQSIGEEIDPDLFFRFADGGVERSLVTLTAATGEGHVAGPWVVLGGGALDEKDLEVSSGGAHDERDRGAGEAGIGVDQSGLPALQRGVERADSEVDHWA